MNNDTSGDHRLIDYWLHNLKSSEDRDTKYKTVDTGYRVIPVNQLTEDGRFNWWSEEE